MIQKYELLSDEDVRSFNSKYGKMGITTGYDLFGSPVLYVDTILLGTVDRNQHPKNEGRKRRRISPESCAEARRLKAEGMSVRQIAQTLSISIGAVSKITGNGNRTISDTK